MIKHDVRQECCLATKGAVLIHSDINWGDEAFLRVDAQSKTGYVTDSTR